MPPLPRVRGPRGRRSIPFRSALLQSGLGGRRAGASARHEERAQGPSRLPPAAPGPYPGRWPSALRRPPSTKHPIEKARPGRRGPGDRGAPLRAAPPRSNPLWPAPPLTEPSLLRPFPAPSRGARPVWRLPAPEIKRLLHRPGPGLLPAPGRKACLARGEPASGPLRRHPRAGSPRINHAAPEVYSAPDEQTSEGAYDRLPAEFQGYREIYPPRRAPSPPEMVLGHWQNNAQPIYFDRPAFISHLMDPSHRLSMIDNITLDDAVELINNWYARQGFFLTNKGWIPSLNHRSTSHRSVRRCSGLRQCLLCSRFYSNKRSKKYCTTHRHMTLASIPCKFSITFQWNCQPGHAEGVLSAVVSPHSFENGVVCMHSHPCITRKAAQRDDEARARQAAVSEELELDEAPGGGFGPPFGFQMRGLQSLSGDGALLGPGLGGVAGVTGVAAVGTVGAVGTPVGSVSAVTPVGSMPSLSPMGPVHSLPSLTDVRPFDLAMDGLSHFPALDDSALPLGLGPTLSSLRTIAPLQLSLPMSQDVEQPMPLPQMSLRLSRASGPDQGRRRPSPRDEVHSLPASIGDDAPLPGDSLSVPVQVNRIPGAQGHQMHPLPQAQQVPRVQRLGPVQQVTSLPTLSGLTSPFDESIHGPDGPSVKN